MDSPEQRYARVKDAVQQAILHNFPNPERKGCPGDEVVREVAGRRELIEDEAWRHITHCSPCYATFLEYKEEFRRHRRRRGLEILVTAAAVVVIAVLISIFEVGTHGKQSGIAGEETAVLDLRGTSPLRGATQPAVPQLFLPNRRLDLTIYLPFGSEPAKYQVRLTKAGRTLATAEGKAEIKEGNTLLRVKINLSKYAPGHYTFSVRKPPWSWIDHPVTLR